MAVKRKSHKARYGIDYSTRRLGLGPIDIEVDSSNTVQEMFVLSEALADDKDLMARLSQKMLGFVQENLRSGLRPVSAATIERRKYAMNDRTSPRGPVSSTAPLISSGALLGNLRAYSKQGFASVRRGKQEWYGFLHDLGVGRLDERAFMSLSGSQIESLSSDYDTWVDEVLAR